MPANIVKRAHRQALIAQHDQTLSSHGRDQEIAHPRDLALVSNQHPLPAKNLCLFLGENLRPDEVALWQRPRASRERLGRLAKGRHESRWAISRRLDETHASRQGY